MKLLLIQPNSTKEVNREYVSLQYPINLGYIASVLLNEGHEVKMLDFNVMSKDKLADFLERYSPQIVGITAMTSTINNAEEIISAIKKINKEIITILGGVHASALPIQTIQKISDLDFLVFGEGEKTIVELVDYIENQKKSLSNLKKIKGVVFRDGKKIIKNAPRELIEDLDTIPYPARDLLPMALYSKHHVSRGFSRKEKRIIEIMTSRGCPNKCIFCAGHINYGYRVRFRSYENIIGEINESIERYSINHVSIEDDTFTLNKELVNKLCHFFKEKNISWNCNTRVNTVDFPLLKLMADSGCKKVAFGIESGNSEILTKNKKGISVEQAINAVRNAKKAGIRYIECDFIIGSHIDETIESINDSKKLIFKLMPDFLMISVICPYPGTEIYDLMLKEGYLSKKADWSQFSFFGDLNRFERIRYLNSDQMNKIQRDIIRDYYSSYRYIFYQLKQIRSISEIKYFGRLGLLFFREFLISREKNLKI